MRVSIYASILLSSLPNSTNMPIDSRLDVFTRVESDQAYRRLVKVLTDLQMNQQEASIATLQPLIDCLTQRWDMIKRTRSSYEISYSLANQAYLSAADDLCKEYGENKYINKYKLLIPPLMVDRDHITGSILDLRPHEMVFSDDVFEPAIIVPIIVYQCLTEAKKSGKLMLSIAPNHEKIRELNDAEKSRVINHSEITKKYYAGVVKEDELFDGLLSAQEYRVATAYGAVGEAKQRENVINNIKDNSELIHILKNVLKSQEWLPFLSSIPTIDLKRIFADNNLNINQLVTLMQDDKIYIHNEDAHNRCTLLVFYELYKRLRDEERLTLFGEHKNTKIDSVNQVQQSLASDKPLASLIDELNNPTLSQGRLLGFKIQIQKLIDPNFKPEPSMVQKVFGYFGY